MRETGAMLGKIVFDGEEDIPFHDPNKENQVAIASCSEVITYGNGGKRICLVGLGEGNTISSAIFHDKSSFEHTLGL